MSTNQDKLKEEASIQYQSDEELLLSEKIFKFFYDIIIRTKMNKILLCFYMVIQSIQLSSYAFSSPFTYIWKLNSNTIDKIQTITAIFRLTGITKYINLNTLIIIWVIIIVLIFLFILNIIIIIKFNISNTCYYRFIIEISNFFSSIFLTVGIIPIFETIVIILKCKDGRLYLTSNNMKCWNGIHLLYGIISVIFAILIFIVYIFFDIFYFNPFNEENSTIKTSISSDIFYIIICILNTISYIFIDDE